MEFSGGRFAKRRRGFSLVELCESPAFSCVHGKQERERMQIQFQNFRESWKGQVILINVHVEIDCSRTRTRRTSLQFMHYVILVEVNSSRIRLQGNWKKEVKRFALKEGWSFWYNFWKKGMKRFSILDRKTPDFLVYLDLWYYKIFLRKWIKKLATVTKCY